MNRARAGWTSREQSSGMPSGNRESLLRLVAVTMDDDRDQRSDRQHRSEHDERNEHHASHMPRPYGPFEARASVPAPIFSYFGRIL